MKTLSTAHKELLEKLKPEEEVLVQLEEQCLKLESWEKSEHQKSVRSSVRLIDAVSALRDITLTRVQSSASARLAAIRTSKSSIQAAQKEKDTFRFLQRYAGVHEAVEKARNVDLRKGLEPGEDRDQLVQEIRQSGDEMVEQGVELWSSLLAVVDPENHGKIFSFTHDFTFDPKMLGQGMSLSEDHKKVFYNNTFGKCSSHTLLIKPPTNDEEVTHDKPVGNQKATVPSQAAFDQFFGSGFGSVPAISAVVSTESVKQLTFSEEDLGTSDVSWVVSLNEDYDWTIGVCDQQAIKNIQDGHVFGLSFQNNTLSCISTECEEGEKTKMQKNKQKHRVTSPLVNLTFERPKKVEVFWDFASSSLSFFSRANHYQRAELLVTKIDPDNLDLYPFVRLGTETTSDQISPETSKDYQCQCGRVYNLSNMPQVNQYGKFTCNHCRNPIKTICVFTEVLCKLEQ